MRCVRSQEHAISPCLGSARQALLQRPSGFCRVLIRTHRDNMDTNTEQGRNDRHVSSDTVSVSNSREKCRVVKCVIIILSACNGNRTGCALWSQEFTVLIKDRQDIYERCAKWEMWRLVKRETWVGDCWNEIYLYRLWSVTVLRVYKTDTTQPQALV